MYTKLFGESPYSRNFHYTVLCILLLLVTSDLLLHQVYCLSSSITQGGAVRKSTVQSAPVAVGP